MKNNQLSNFNRNMMLLTLLLGSFLMLLSETFLNNGLPAIMAELHVSQENVQWLSTGYYMVTGLMIPLSGWMFNRFPIRKTYITLLFIFLIGSALACFSFNFPLLLLGRLIQAISAGAVIPLVQNIVLILFPKEKRGLILGITGIIIAFAPAIGPTLSGYIIDTSGWRSLFLLLIPITVLILLSAFFVVHNINPTSKKRVDSLSFFYSLIGFGSLLYSLSLISNTGNPSILSIIFLIIGCIFIWIFAQRQFKVKNPLINLSVFTNKTFTLTTLLSGISNVALLGVELVIPLYLQDVHQVSAFVSGLILMPGAILMGILNPITGNLYDKWGIKKMSIIGYAILSIGTLPMIWFTPTTNLVFITIVYAIRILGIAFVLMPTFTAAINSLHDDLAIHGNAASSTFRQVFGSLGTAILMMIVTLVTSNSSHNHILSLNRGYQAAFIFSFIMAVIGLVLSFALKKEK